ncbi:eCIS core domain-containing protein [Anabaena azotica]|nr:DUF4157 domain-containing protein [Anabaena azotica]
MNNFKFGHRKAGTSDFSNPSLVSPNTPTLANPIRGFGLPSNNDIQTVTSPSTQLPTSQTSDEQSLLSNTIQRKSSGHDISRIPLRCPQAKLAMGEPGDKYEQEADFVAKQVMRMAKPESTTNIEAIDSQHTTPQEYVACEQTQGKAQTKPLLQLAKNDSLPDQTTDNIESLLDSTKGGGSPLSNEVRNFMEPRFGHDFSNVLVHNDSTAVQMNQQLGAQAFTYGSDIYFGAGKTPANNELMAHELTHVVQQKGVIQPKLNIQQTDQQISLTPAAGDAAGASPPSPALPSKPVAKLKLHADTETVNRSDLTLQELIKEARVGHSWISLEYTNKKQIPPTIGEPTQTLLKSGSTAFGFWPLVNRASNFSAEEQSRIDQGQTPGAGASTNPMHTGFSLNPFKNVPGRVEEPDTAHTPKGTKEYNLTQIEVGSLLNYVNSKRNAKYNLYSFNCTTFAVEAVRSAGKAAPSGSLWGICLPNALYKDIYQMYKAGDKSVTVAPLEPNERHD